VSTIRARTLRRETLKPVTRCLEFVKQAHLERLNSQSETDALKKRTWIFTTTDKKALEAAVGASGVIEIVFGEPYSIDGSWKRCAMRCPTGDRPGLGGDAHES
jgi:hypothetical protein